jgi:RNA polymerase sigma-70 factor (ECF subfamily)
VRTTSVSLLDRARDPDDADAWRRLHDLYRPLIVHYLRREPALASELEDLTQDVLTDLVRKLPTFQRERKGSFRAWLRLVTHSRVVDHLRRLQRAPRLANDVEGRAGILAGLADPQSALSQEWDRAHDQYVLGRLMELIRADFEPTTWQAFVMLVREQRSTAEVARALNVSANAALVAKSRVLKRLREEAAGLIE